ncbi:FtsH protease activity modulator HflK [Niameybacter massiliensis]|uniref:FtsH protease activity modulator HflK n=1 Tax=Niameybacter massiliensis TaxID=1658108 RepID=UPI0006B64B08|nr:FtsH protease activity modulator HflK [Niameybacter massiliensis]
MQEEDNIIIDIPNPKPPKDFMKPITHIAMILATVFIGAILILGSVYRLSTGTVAVITRFGAITGVNEQAGIHFKVPFIDKVQKVDVQSIHKMEYGYRTAQPGTPLQDPTYADENAEEQVIIEAKSNNASIILLNLIVRYQVNDPINYLYEVDDIEGTMRLALEDVIRNTLPSFSINEALQNKELIDEAILPKFQRKLDKYNTGIKIVQVTTQNVSLLPAVEETRQKVEESNQYKQGREEEAQKYANTVLPTAKAEATKLYEDAKGYSAEVIANANADVAEFEALYSQYVKNPEIVKEKYYLDAMQEILKNNKLVIDQTQDNNLLKFYNIPTEGGEGQ